MHKSCKAKNSKAAEVEDICLFCRTHACMNEPRMQKNCSKGTIYDSHCIINPVRVNAVENNTCASIQEIQMPLKKYCFRSNTQNTSIKMYCKYSAVLSLKCISALSLKMLSNALSS